MNQVRKRRRRNRASQRRGASAVEFALVFPLVMIFFTGLIAFAQAILLRDTAQHAAYEGARKAIVLEASNADSVNAARDFLNTMRIRNPEIVVSPAQITTTTETVVVTVRIPFQDNAWIAGAMIPEGWAMGAEVRLTKNPAAD